MENIIIGTNKMFAVINTTNYNEDENYSISVCNLNELEGLGFNEDDVKKCSTIKVDDAYKIEIGVVIVRIA